ncbi:unnamed protein product [Cylindrotheca closterium]|uniref:Peroxisomal membrane protein 2 n=1 Tax=Cylindrotheca closterium TaxID=2856 RepID=A0AAD2JKT3_9STRA|nr:unnamed protein product [Cylindrotheca closterium]
MASPVSQFKLLAFASACLIASSDAFSTSSNFQVTTGPRIQPSITSTPGSLTIRRTSLGPLTATIQPNTRTSSIQSSSTALNMAFSDISDFYANCPLQAAVLTCGFKASVADVIAQIKGASPDEEEEEEDEDSSFSPMTIMESSHMVEEPQEHQDNHFDFENPMENFESMVEDIDLSPIEDLDGKRNFAYIIYGGIFIGLMCHLEYDYAFPLMFARNGVDYAVQQHVPQTILSEILFDNFISGPLLWLPPAYLIKAVVYDYSFKEGLEKYVHDIKENDLLKRYWQIWLPAQTISFSVVPEHFRVVWMASVSFFWFILFSTLASKTDDVDAEAALAKSN